MPLDSLGAGVAFLAGVLSFLSPCVFPLWPSYASFVTGMSVDELAGPECDRPRGRRAVLVHGGLFILGFSIVFILLGASATLVGSALARYSRWVERVGGALLVLFGLHLLRLVRIPGADREWRVQLSERPLGYAGSILIGVAFGAGWTPCIGPILGGILTLAATGESVLEGMGLLAVYAAGLALPFLATTLALDRFLARFRRLRRWLPWVSRASGALLILVGVLLFTGSFARLAGILTRWTPDFLLQRL